jgi:hypothetical protein
MAKFLSRDDVIAARMVAARDVLHAAGFAVEPPEWGDIVATAVVWQRSARGFLTPLFRACAADMVRGLLRLR